MVEVQLNTEVAYGQATSNLEGYKFNNSGVSYSDFKSIIYFSKRLECYLEQFYSQNGDYGNTTFKPSYDMSFSMRKIF
jgi:hypothetical protein